MILKAVSPTHFQPPVFTFPLDRENRRGEESHGVDPTWRCDEDDGKE